MKRQPTINRTKNPIGFFAIVIAVVCFIHLFGCQRSSSLGSSSLLPTPAPTPEPNFPPNASSHGILYAHSTQPNLLPNPNFSCSGGFWHYGNGGSCDSTVTHSADGSGSVRMSIGGNKALEVWSDTITLGSGDCSGTYIFSGYIKSDNPDGYGLMTVVTYTSEGNIVNPTKTNEWVNIAHLNEWEEWTTMPIKMASNECKVTFNFSRYYTQYEGNNGGNVWIDDVYFGRGNLGFRKPPSTKRVLKQFERVKIDELGNFYINKHTCSGDIHTLCIKDSDCSSQGKGDTCSKSDNWVQFFPYAIHQRTDGFDWVNYCNAGFNLMHRNIIGRATNFMDRAAAVKCDLNPYGLMIAMDIGYYMTFRCSNHLDWQNCWTDADCDIGATCKHFINYWNDKDIKNYLNYKNSAYNFYFYYDNESREYLPQWRVLYKKIESVNFNPSTGKYLYPIFMNLGSTNAVRAYNDTVDSYADYWYDTVILINNLEGIEKPQGGPVFTFGVYWGRDWRHHVWKSIMNGAHAVTYFADPLFPGNQRCLINLIDLNGSGNCKCDNDTSQTCNINGDTSVANGDVWNSFAPVRRDIDALMPLIKEKWWTSWTAVSSDPNFEISTREHNGEGYILLINTDYNNPHTTTITVNGLDYNPTGIVNFITGQTVADANVNCPVLGGCTFTLRLPKIDANGGTGAFRLVRPKKQ